MYAQALFFRIMFIVMAVGVLFLIVHAALQGFSQSAGVLTQTLQ
jgi:hypothetical protein